MKKLQNALAKIAGTALAIMALAVAPILVLIILLNPPKEYHHNE